MKNKIAIVLTICATALATSARATEDFCAVVLKTPDGFLALREGPGTRFRMQARLHRGDVLFADTRSCMIERPDICDNKMEWTYVNSVPRFDGPLKEAKHFTRGWVARNFIQEFLCPSDE